MIARSVGSSSDTVEKSRYSNERCASFGWRVVVRFVGGVALAGVIRAAGGLAVPTTSGLKRFAGAVGTGLGFAGIEVFAFVQAALVGADTSPALDERRGRTVLRAATWVRETAAAVLGDERGGCMRGFLGGGGGIAPSTGCALFFPFVRSRCDPAWRELLLPAEPDTPEPRLLFSARALVVPEAEQGSRGRFPVRGRSEETVS